MIVLDDEHRTFCSNDCKISYDKDTKKATKILSWSAWQLFRHKMSLIQKKHKND
jgi:predicted nucleic acid-binding Zn ribbon protein